MTKEEKNKKAREYMAVYRQTEAYRLWLVESRERRRQLKEKYRRQRGAKPIQQIHAESLDRRNEKQQKRDLLFKFRQEFIGPPIPTRKTVGDGRYQKFLYQRSHVREYQIKKRHRCALEVTKAYAKEQLRIGNPSDELIEVMRQKLLIKRAISKLTDVIKEKVNA